MTKAVAFYAGKRGAVKSQRSAVTRFAKREGFRIVTSVLDSPPDKLGECATKVNRQLALDELLETAKREGAKVVLVASVGCLAETDADRVDALLALRVRGVRALTTLGHDLTADHLNMIPLPVMAHYVQSETLRVGRRVALAKHAEDERRKEMQVAWRSMSEALRACAPEDRAYGLRELAAL